MTTSTETTTLVRLATRWTDLWNGDAAAADEILAPDFRIEFGAVIDDPDPTRIDTPAAMADFVARWRAARGDLRFALQGEPVVGDAGVAFGWSVALPGVEARSGIDLLRVVDGKVTRVLSVTGDRLFRERPV